jgi:hypothetical protein
MDDFVGMRLGWMLVQDRGADEPTPCVACLWTFGKSDVGSFYFRNWAFVKTSLHILEVWWSSTERLRKSVGNAFLPFPISLSKEAG